MFTSGIMLAKFTGNWQNKITTQEYLSYTTPERDTFSSFDGMDPKKMQRMILMMKQLKEQQMYMQSSQEQQGE